MLAGFWNDITPLRYIQNAEDMRPDVWVVATDATGFGILRERAIEERYPYYIVRATAAGLRLLPTPLWDEDRILHGADLRVSDAVRWRGHDLPQNPVHAGDVLPITLYWEVDAPVGQDWITFMQMFDEEGNKVAQVDQMPGNGFYPPTAWQAGLLLADQYEMSLPADLPAGRYQLLFGWYWEGERLNWADGQDAHTLAEIEISAPAL